MLLLIMDPTEMTQVFVVTASDGIYSKHQLGSVCFKISDELANGTFFLIPFKVFFQLNHVLPSDI